MTAIFFCCSMHSSPRCLSSFSSLITVDWAMVEVVATACGLVLRQLASRCCGIFDMSSSSIR